MKTLALIPAFNAERTIGKVVRVARKYVDTVMVVDNGSHGNTDKEAKKNGAWVIYEYTQGQGAATRRGLEYGFLFDVIVTLDSDGQHNPDEIPQILKPILEGKADMVIGARFMPCMAKGIRRVDYLDEGCYEMEEYNYIAIPKYRKFGIDIINWIYNVCNGKKLIDTQSCFRAYTRQLIEKLTIEENGFGFSTEVLIKARKMKARMVEVPIECIYHNLEQDSSMNPVKHGIGVALKTLWWRIKLWS